MSAALVSALRLRCHRHAVAPTVAVRLWLPGGCLAESRPGSALVSGRLLTEGTRRRSWEEIATATESLGIDVAGMGGVEVTGVAVDALSADWRTALELAAELTLEASFPEERLERVCRQTASELASLAERPEVAAAWVFMEQLYGRRHPLSRPLQGSAESLAALSRADCLAFHRRALESGILVSVAGDVEEDEVAAVSAEIFAAAPAAGGPASMPPPPVARRASRREISLAATEQAQLYVGQLTVPAGHPDLPALQVAAVALGAGPGLVGRIPGRIREREGLAYAASAATVGGAGVLPGRLVVHLATAPGRVEAALLAVREELDRFVSEGVSEAELEEARTYLLGSEPFRRESPRQLAALGARSMLYGVSWDEPGWLEEALGGIDREAVGEAVRRHLDPGRLAVTVGLPRG